MQFQNSLTEKLSSVSISNIDSELDINNIILTEDERSKLAKIIAAVKKFLSIDITSLFRFAETGGEVTESAVIIHDLWPDVIKEAVEDISVKTAGQGNYHKIVELRVKAEFKGASGVYVGYVIERLTVDNDKIREYVTSSLADWTIGMPVPFRWFRSIEDATNELTAEERKLAAPPVKKPALSKKAVGGANIHNVASAVSKHLGRPEIAETIAKLDRAQLMKIAQEGKQAAKGMGAWNLGKKIFLAYLGLGAIVTGIPGIAALVIGFLVVLGIDRIKNKKNEQTPKDERKAIDDQFKELADKATKGQLSPEEKQQFERMRAARIRAMRTKADMALRGELPE